MAHAPRRILLVSHGLPPARIGGAELVTWSLARDLVRRGHAAAVFHRDDAPDVSPGLLRRDQHSGVTTYALGVRPGHPSSPHARGAFARIVQLWQPDLVWVHHLDGLDLAVASDAITAGVPLAVTLHDYWWMCPRGQLVREDGSRCPGPDSDRCSACVAPGSPWPLRRWVRRATARHARWRRRRARTILLDASGVSAPSVHVARRHEAWLGRQDVVRMVANPMPTLQRQPPPPGHGPLRVGYLGSLIPTKGIETLLRAAHRVPTGTVTLTLHGALPAGRAAAAWRHRVRNLAARTGAHLAGPYDPAGVGRLLTGLELVVLPSEWEENAPLVLDEAWAVGRPVLASALGGMQELLADGVRGRLTAPGDADAWAAALADVEGWRRALGTVQRAPAGADGAELRAADWAIGLARR